MLGAGYFFLLLTAVFADRSARLGNDSRKLSQTLGLEEIPCPVRTMSYGGIPTGGGYQPYTEFEVGAMRIAEEAHCILGSLGNVHYGDPSTSWQEDLRYEYDHIMEELELIERDIKEYSRGIYARQLAQPRRREYAGKTVQSLRDNAPRLSQKAVLYGSVVERGDLPEPVKQVALSCYLLLMVLAQQMENAVDGWPEFPARDPFSTFEMRDAVSRLRRAVDGMFSAAGLSDESVYRGVP